MTDLATPADLREQAAALSRRKFLRRAGSASALGLSSLWALDRAAGAVACSNGPTPGQVEGPFFFEDRLIRRNIVEGMPGLPLRLDLKLVRLPSMAPIPDAEIEIWHSEANGYYSGYAPNPTQQRDTRGRNYCRGIQLTNRTGDVSFDTIYPGYYPGRTPHIHCKIIVGNEEVLTTQFYFTDELSDRVYGIAEPYTQRGRRTVFNRNDGIYDQRLELTMRAQPGGLVGSYTICIR